MPDDNSPEYIISDLQGWLDKQRQKAPSANTPAAPTSPMPVFSGRGSSPVPPSPEDAARNNDRIWSNLTDLETNNPGLATTIAQSPAALAISQEVAATVNDSEITDYVLSAMLGDEELKPFDSVIDRLDNNSALVSQFFQDYSGDFNAREKSYLAFLLAPLDAQRKDQTLAIAHQYIQANGIDSDEKRANLFVFITQIADGKLNEARGEDTILGRLGETVDLFGEPIREAAAQIWARVADPYDSTYREHLSIGQNFAISGGQTPGTKGWEIASATADGMAQFGLDPVGWATGMKAGSTLAKTFPRLADAGKVATSFKSAVPWFGKHATQLPRFSRGWTTRMGWALQSRTLDEMFEVGQAGNKLADAMFTTAQRGGIAALRESFPVMERALDGIGDLIVRSDSSDQVADVLKEALSGGFMNPDGALNSVLKNSFEKAESTYNSVVDEALASGEIGLGDVGGAEGLNAAKTSIYSFSGEVRAGMALTESALDNSNEVKLAFRGTENVLDLSDPDKVAAVARWLQENGTEQGDNILANRLLAGNLSFTDQMVARLDAYAVSYGADVVRFGDNAILTTKGIDRAVTGIDKTTDATHLVDLTKDLATDLAWKRHQYKTALNGDSNLWVLNEMPKHAPRGLFRQIKGLWRNTASNNSRRWWAQKRRIRSAQIFGKAPPSAIDIDNTADMVEGFRRWARAYGASREWINNKINDLVGTSFMDRHEAVTQAIIDLAEQADHPLLRHRLVEYVEGQAVREMMPGPGGAEMAIAASRSDGITRTAVPLIPSLMRRSVRLPGPDFHRSFLRYRRIRDSKLPWITGRGVVRRTQKNRQNIVDALKDRLQVKIDGLDDPQAQSVLRELLNDDDRLFAMAYGSVFEHGIGNGVGLLGRFGATLNQRFYTPVHSFFSAAQLAFRPASWMQRVNLDEQARGALTDLPSIFRNPFRYGQHWWDAYHIAKAEKWAAANSTWVAGVAEAIFAKGDEAAVRGAVFHFFPGAKKVLGESPTLRELRNFVDSELKAIASGSIVAQGRLNLSRHAVREVERRGRKLANVRRIEAEYGLRPEFHWDDASEIQMQGQHMILVDELSGAVAPLEWGPTITQHAAYQFGGAWASKAGQYARDPVMRVAMRASVRRARAQSIRPAAAEIVRSRHWYELRRNFIATALEHGWDDVLDDDLMLAERVLDRILMGQVDHIFSPMWNTAREPVTTKVRVLEDILSPGRTATFNAHDGAEYVFDFRKGSGAGLRREMRKFTAAEHTRATTPNATQAGMPDRIAAYFDPFHAADDGLYGAGFNKKGVTSAYRRFVDWSIHTFGERATQNLNRRPAYLAAHRRSFQRFKAMGLKDEAARLAAHGEATRLVNYVYYNMDDTAPILRKMNKVIPFFSAAWEVAQTWAYKIPNEMAGGAGFVYGYPKMIRSVDRFFDSMINAGLLQVLDQDGKEDRESRNLIERMGIPYQLVLSQNLEMQEAHPFSNMLSAAGNHLVNTPFTLVEHLANLGGSLADAAEDVPYLGDALDAVTPDERIDLGSSDIRLRLANPLDPLGEGVGNAVSFHLGLNPIVASTFAAFKDKVYAAIDGKTLETTGQTFATIEEKTGIDSQEMLRVNKDSIVEAIGESEYNKLLRGDTLIDDYRLPSGVELAIPRSSLIGTVIDDLFFAFDSSETPLGTFYHMQPSWSKYIWRGLGAWAGNDGHPNGFVEFFDGPAGTGQVEAAITDGIRYLEMHEGAVTALRAQASDLHAFIKQSTDTFVWDAAKNTIAPVEGVDAGSFAAAEQEFQEKWEALDLASQTLMNRAGDLAGGQLLTRGLFGLFLPSNPSTYAENAHLEGALWSSKDFAEGEDIPTVKGVTDFEMFAQLMTDWWEDPAGDTAKLTLKALHPELEMFWKGSSFWADGTKPIEAQDAEDFFRLSGEELIQQMPGEIFLMDQVKSGAMLMKEAEIRRQFGEDPMEAVRNILTNYEDYKAIGEEMDIMYAEWEWFDDLFFDGQYADFQSRERRTAPRLAEEVRLATIDKFRNLDEISDIVADITDATPDEAADLSRRLRELGRESRDRIYELLDLPEYQGAIGERERILGEWWKQVDDHYAEIGEIFAPLDDPGLSSEEQGLVFENWRIYQNEHDSVPFVVDGVELPNEFQRSWSSKTDEERENKRLRDITKPPAWLSDLQIQRIAEQFPSVAGYLPADTAVYDELTAFKNKTKRLVAAGEMTQNRATEFNKEAEALVSARLVEEGREKEVVWMNATPLERLEIAENVPPYLQALMPHYHNVVGTLRANDTSLKSTATDVKRLRNAFWALVDQHLANVPGGYGEFKNLGLIMFGDDYDNVNEIGALLFFDDRYNSLYRNVEDQ